MGSSNNNKREQEYRLYAEQCLKMVEVAQDRTTRVIQREMAAEWLRLADSK